MIEHYTEEDNYKLFIGDGGIHIHTEWKINNCTLHHRL